MAVCDACGYRRAVVYQRHSGRRLCRECFIGDVKARVSREVERWRMVEPGDRLALGLSGGKDSLVLLDVMAEIVGPSRIFGVSIIEGIPGYNREDHVRRLVGIARDMGVDVIVASIREYTGHSLYEIYSRARARGIPYSACTYCGISRRRILNYYARVYGATKTVTAHNLDDEAQTMIVNYLRGDLAGMVKMHPLSRPKSGSIVAKVKPLRKVYEWETATYALLKGFPFQETECMFINARPTLRARAREALYALEEREPGALLRMMESMDEALAPLASKYSGLELPPCERCGEPTSPSRRLCKLCEILEEAGIRPIYITPGRVTLGRSPHP